MDRERIKRLADEAYGYFEKRSRTDGRDFWTLKDGRPDWVRDLAHAAHGGYLPDDWRYEFIVEALVALSEGGAVDADIYTGNLCAWLASNINRVAYVDEMLKETDGVPGIVEALQAGQIEEKHEVLTRVTEFLTSMPPSIEENP